MAEETKNQGQQEYAENISGQAKEIISAALEETKNNGTSPVLGDPNVTDNFKGLPMRELQHRLLQQPKLNRNWQRQHGISTRKLLLMKTVKQLVYWNSILKDRYSRMEK